MPESLKNAYNKLKNGWTAHTREIMLFAGVLLVGIIGFELGVVEGQSRVSAPLVIEVPTNPAVPEKTSGASAADTTKQPLPNGKTSSSNQSAAALDPTSTCRFVGSKNSDKYHLPTCSFAKRIKPENRVCFASEDEAKAKGYTAGCLK